MRTGLEKLLDDPRRVLGRARVGLVANPTTVDQRLRHAADLLHAHPAVDLRLLFGPEHGIRGSAQDMIGVSESRAAATGLAEVSLYGSTFASLSPTPQQLAEIDMLVFDVQDVGARYYTYAATMALCMRAAKSADVKVVVLDRPNPIGGLQVEGGGLKRGLENFCALYPVPQRHGLTVGELARLYNTTFGIGCDLEVVPCEGWRRAEYYDETSLPWVTPSPNMPTLDTAIVYPGMCLLEGTNLSEGRGTTRPFELFGAPFIHPETLVAVLKEFKLPGVLFRPLSFQPTFQKHAGLLCGGAQIHITDREKFKPFKTGVAILKAIHNTYPRDFTWNQPPYEYEEINLPIDILAGSSRLRKDIESWKNLDEMEKWWKKEAKAFDKIRRKYLIYE